MKKRVYISLFFALAWIIISISISQIWLTEVADVCTWTGAIIIISGIAFIPGFICAFLVMSMVVSKKTKKIIASELDEDITILVACRNEEEDIYNTLSSIANQRYSKDIVTYVIDNASTDNTSKEVLRAQKDFPTIKINLLHQPIKGKHNALNLALDLVETEYVITIDGDTRLEQGALRNIVYAIQNNCENCAAVAGWVIERNKKTNFLTKMQTYDYAISIGAVKKMQGMYNATLVAQGAFSIYRTDVVRQVGGWPDTIGEDIVLSWTVLNLGYHTSFCEHAVAYTTVPSEFKVLFKQRARWARGMIEALKRFKPWHFDNKLPKMLTYINLVMPYIDFSYVFFLGPGIILALCGYKLLAGIMTIVLLPVSILQLLIMRANLPSREFSTNRSLIGFLGFIFIYQYCMSIMSLTGYVQEFKNLKRDWK